MKKRIIRNWEKLRRKSKIFNSAILLLFILCNLALHAQNIVKLTGIKGTAFITGNDGPNQARAKALNDAKINALKAAGIAENINSYQTLFSSQDKNNYSQFFSSDIQSEIQGEVQECKITGENVVKKSEFEIVSELTIDATVIKYETKPDINFITTIDSVKSVYNNDEPMVFQAKSTIDAYLTVFILTEKDASLLYPNDYEKVSLLGAMKPYRFPRAKIDYILHANSKPPETNQLIFVFTKKAIPYIKMDKDQLTKAEDIFSWLYAIPPDQRKVVYQSLSIR